MIFVFTLNLRFMVDPGAGRGADGVRVAVEGRVAADLSGGEDRPVAADGARTKLTENTHLYLL